MPGWRCRCQPEQSNYFYRRSKLQNIPARFRGKAGKDYLQHSPEWYRFNDDLLLFDFQKGTWKILYDIPGMARAGGILLHHNHTLYMICGELKPGIRSAQITTYPLNK